MVVHFTDANFQSEVIESEKPVLVDFYAEWCGPCKAVAPIVEELAGTYEGKVKIGKVNVDEAGEVAQNYGIMSIPTFILFKNGQIVEKVTGALNKDALVAKLDGLL